MVERKTTRSIRIEGDDYIAIKKEEFTNGKNKKIVQVMEEHNITMEEVNDILDNLALEEMETVNKEITNLMDEQREIKEEIKHIVNDRKYIKFKRDIDNETIKEYLETMKKEGVLKASDNRLQELIRTKEDIISWEKQFKEMKQAIEDNISK